MSSSLFVEKFTDNLIRLLGPNNALVSRPLGCKRIFISDLLNSKDRNFTLSSALSAKKTTRAVEIPLSQQSPLQVAAVTPAYVKAKVQKYFIGTFLFCFLNSSS
jgi:hypothetical protein